MDEGRGGGDGRGGKGLRSGGFFAPKLIWSSYPKPYPGVLS